jgi:HD-like signal output (HDOD) protein
MRRLVGDIKKAVYFLGFLEVSNIVMTMSLLKLKEVLSSREQQDMFNEIMRVSITTAHFTHGIARSVSLADTAIAFTSGLLHSMGRLVLLYNKPHDYEALWCTADSGTAPSIEAERLIFGTDHARLGALAVDRWNLPGKIGALVGNYHTPEAIANTDLRNLAYALALASTAAQTTCRGAKATGSEDPPGVLTAFANALDMSPGEAVCLLESIRAQLPVLPDELVQH